MIASLLTCRFVTACGRLIHFSFMHILSGFHVHIVNFGGILWGLSQSYGQQGAYFMTAIVDVNNMKYFLLEDRLIWLLYFYLFILQDISSTVLLFFWAGW